MAFVFNDTATTEIYTLSLHDALPIFGKLKSLRLSEDEIPRFPRLDDREVLGLLLDGGSTSMNSGHSSEEHTSELQSRQYLVCRLLLDEQHRGLLVPPRHPFAVAILQI